MMTGPTGNFENSGPLGWPGDIEALSTSQIPQEVIGDTSTEVREDPVVVAALRAEVERLRRLAYTDELTGLPNRRAIMEMLDTLVENEPGSVAVLFVDLDDLKLKNTQGGHKAGDKLISDAAERLSLDITGTAVDSEDRQLIDSAHSVISASLRTHDEEKGEDRPHDIEGSDAARLGGDEFLVVIRGVHTQEQLTVVNHRIITNLEIAGINASTGAALHQVGQTREELVQLADLAMDENKKERRLERQERERTALSAEELAAHEAVEAIRQERGVNLDRHYRLYGESSRPPA